MAPFKVLYGRRCRSPIGWFDAFKVRPWGTDLLTESLAKVKVIQEKLLAAQSRQKEHADRKPMSCLFEFLSRCASGVPCLMLKRYHVDGLFIIRWDSILLDENPSYEEEPIAIMDREVRKLRSKEIASVKVQWKDHPGEEATWEIEFDMRNNYPQFFTESDDSNTHVALYFWTLNVLRHCRKERLTWNRLHYYSAALRL
ncbi:uncharacterized protein LOC132062429 [Lycium ferocissimum]|uniref:uncharacterized protein LOC132062429 n=1 Tax=Lycium ferocissimum TaxID=112874 RepID=UPI0028158F4D|nr:uncharacterized protein LOC132062429 [Lycium ferocissimum]